MEQEPGLNRIRFVAALSVITFSIAWVPSALAQGDIDLSLVQSVHGGNATLYGRSPHGGWREQAPGNGQVRVLREVSAAGSTLVLEAHPGELLYFDLTWKTITLKQCPEPPLTCSASAGTRIDTIQDFSYRLPPSLHALKNLDSVQTVYLPAQVRYERVAGTQWRRLDKNDIVTAAAASNPATLDVGTKFLVTKQVYPNIELHEMLKTGGLSSSFVLMNFTEAKVEEWFSGKPVVVEPILDVRRLPTDPNQNAVALAPDQAAATHASIMFQRGNRSITTDGKTLTLANTSQVGGLDASKFVIERAVYPPAWIKKSQTPAADVFHIRSLGSAGGTGYVFQTSGNSAAIEQVNTNDVDAGSGSLKDSDRELRRLFRLTPGSTSTTIIHLGSGLALSDWSGPSKDLNFGQATGIGLAFSILNVSNDTIMVTLQPERPKVGAAPTDDRLLASLQIYAINHEDRKIALVLNSPWNLVGDKSSNGPNTYSARLTGPIDPAHVGALVKIAVKNTDRSFNVIVSEVQLRGRDLFECNCTLHGVDADPTVVRNLDDITTSDTISFADDGTPSLSADLLKEHLHDVAQVSKLRGTQHKNTLPWLLSGRELFEPLLLTTKEGPAFDDFVGCYATVLGGPGNDHDFIGDFLGLNAPGHPADADITTVFADMTAASPHCQNSSRNSATEAYTTLKIELRELVYQRQRVTNLIATTGRILTEKYKIAEEARALFASLAQIQGDVTNANPTGSDQQILSGIETAAGVLSVIPALSEIAGVANEVATIMGDVLADISEEEAAADDQAAGSLPFQETSRNSLAANILVSVANAKTSLQNMEKKQQESLTSAGQALIADIPMLAESFPRVPDDDANSAHASGNKPLIGDQSKWDIRAGVWKNLLPLKVALIGRPLVSFRTSYAQGVSPNDWANSENYRDLTNGAKTLYSTWDPTLDAAQYEYDQKSLKDYRDRFQKCLDATSCSQQPGAKVTAPDSTLDKGAFLFYSQTPPVRYDDFGVPAGGTFATAPFGLSRAPQQVSVYPNGDIPVPPLNFLKSFDFWGWSLVNRPWNLPVDTSTDNDRSGKFSAASLTVDSVQMTLREYLTKMFDSPLDWYRAFQQAGQLYITRLYRNNLTAPSGFTLLAGDSRPVFLSSAPLPVAAPDPATGLISGVGGNGSNSSDAGYDDAWRMSVVPEPNYLLPRADGRQWNPPYLNVSGNHLELESFGRSTIPIPSKIMLFQDDNYFWFKDQKWSDPVRDVLTVPMPAPQPIRK